MRLHCFADRAPRVRECESDAPVAAIDSCGQGRDGQHSASCPNGPVASDCASQVVNMDQTEFSFHPNARDKIDSLANALLLKVKPLELRAPQPSFPHEVPIAANLSHEDILDVPALGAKNVFGDWVWRGFLHNGTIYGLSEKDYEELQRVLDEVLKTRWIRSYCGKDFVEETVFFWCRARLRAEAQPALSEFIATAALEHVQGYEIFVPIAHLIVQSGFEFGCVRIESITRQFLDGQEARMPADADQITRDNVQQFYSDLRKDIQGRAAVFVRVKAVPQYAEKRAVQIAEIAIALLRLFSAAAYSPWAVCPCAIKGSEFIPETMTFFSHDGNSFQFHKRVAADGVIFWNLLDAELSAIQQSGLDKLGVLIDSAALSPFQIRTRAAVLAYSNGLVLPDVNERLVHSLSAMETLLLGSSSAPIQQTLADRMAFLISRDPAERRAIGENVRAVYGMRSDYIHHRVTSIEKRQLEVFIHHARAVLQAAINSSQTFSTPEEFINAIDTIKFGG